MCLFVYYLWITYIAEVVIHICRAIKRYRMGYGMVYSMVWGIVWYGGIVCGIVWGIVLLIGEVVIHICRAIKICCVEKTSVVLFDFFNCIVVNHQFVLCKVMWLEGEGLCGMYMGQRRKEGKLIEEVNIRSKFKRAIRYTTYILRTFFVRILSRCWLS